LGSPRVLLTGASGRLGRELRLLAPDWAGPAHAEMDITDARQVAAVFNAMAPEVVVHAAAYTDVARAERERERCWRTNVAGTRHVARAAADAGAILIQISTDYVFEGRRGGYREEDVPGPALNYYALSKIAAEEVARTAPRHLVLRTSFRPREWPYPVAFADVYTSQDYVDIIAPDIALVVRHAAEIPFDTLHVATERKSVYELARRRKPDVRAGSKAEARVALPDDVSLDIGRWRALKPQLRAKGA
jgi:dTDP-4-dehydrorhamnose reductase